MGTITAKGAAIARSGPGAIEVIESFTSTATTSAGDVLQMVAVQKGFRVSEVKVDVPTGTLIAVGDGDSSGRYAATATATTVVTGPILGQVGYEYSADDTIDVHLAGTITADEVVTVTVRGTYDDTENL